MSDTSGREEMEAFAMADSLVCAGSCQSIYLPTFLRCCRVLACKLKKCKHSENNSEDVASSKHHYNMFQFLTAPARLSCALPAFKMKFFHIPPPVNLWWVNVWWGAEDESRSGGQTNTLFHQPKSLITRAHPPTSRRRTIFIADTSPDHTLIYKCGVRGSF